MSGDGGPQEDAPDAAPIGDERLASVPRRAAARILDTMLVGVVGLTVQAAMSERVTVVVGGVDEQQWRTPVWVALALFAGSILYEFGMLRWRGQTLGKLALGVRVVGVVTGRPPGVRSAAVRTALTTGLLALQLLGIIAAIAIELTAMFDARLRGLHDKAAGTVVLRT